MVLEKQDSGVCLSTAPSSPTQTAITSSTSVKCGEMSSGSASASAAGNSAGVEKSSDDVFEFPPSAPVTGSCDDSGENSMSDRDNYPLTEESVNRASRTSTPPHEKSDDMMTILTVSDELNSVASGSAVVYSDSGRDSCCSPADSSMFDQRLQTPSPRSRSPSGTQTPNADAVPEETEDHGYDEPAVTQKKSFTQKFQGAWSKLTGKKSTTGQRSNVSRAPVELKISEKDQKIIKIMMERKEAERQKQEALRDQQLRQASSRTSSGKAAASPISGIGSKALVSQSQSSSFNQPSRVTSPVTPQTVPGDCTPKACARPQFTTAVPTSHSSRLSSVSTTIQDGYDNFSRRDSICSSIASTYDSRIVPLDMTRMKFAQKTDKRRQTVEQRLEQQRREMEEHQRQLKLKQEQELQRANSLRMSREQQQALKARLANERVQQRHEHALRQKQQSMIDLSSRRDELEAKLAAAEAKAQKLKEDERQKSKTELQKRLEQSRTRQRQMEEELESWQQELITYNQWQGDNAEKAAKKAVATRSAAACRARLEKEKKQQDNMKKLMTSEEKKMAEMEATIEFKEARSKALAKEKEEMIQRSRARALATKQLRDELRAHYSMNDLDQLTQHVALQNRLLSRVPES